MDWSRLIPLIGPASAALARFDGTLSALRESGLLKILREASGRRPAFYVFSELLNTAEGKDVF